MSFVFALNYFPLLQQFVRVETVETVSAKYIVVVVAVVCLKIALSTNVYTFGKKLLRKLIWWGKKNNVLFLIIKPQ